MNENDKRWISLMEYGHRLGCHQMPERSFSYKGYQFPVCARCTGVIIGEVIAIVLLLFRIEVDITIAIGLLLIMGIDWGIQFMKLLQSNNIRRLITGMSGGIGLMYGYYYGIICFAGIFFDIF